ncbi:MAG TPA: PaaI family thioesterase [Anaerolineales bacterium]|nr:PaaI family thioesterase [Anaerolineales bacterium]HLE73808.1 PaaI family thioesterase [Anaerolineales bacterium]
MPILDKDAWLAQARQAHARTAFGLLGGSILEVDEDSLSVHLPITEKVLQPYGILHGGISLFLIETAASSHAAFGVDLDVARPFGVEINGSHLRSASAGTLKAIARVVRRGRTHIVHEVDVLLEETGELLCRGRMTNYYKPVDS